MQVLSVENLSKSFGKVKALNSISFSIKKGEIVGFLGPNGAGKSTTIMSIMGFLKPDTGNIRVFGFSSSQYSIADIKNKVGYLPGDLNLNINWTGAQHVKLLQKIRKTDGSAEELIDRFELDVTKKVGDLSTGNKQKLGIILALLSNPEFIILDEPTTGLDPVYQQVFYRIIRKRVANGATVLMSSHNLLEVENMVERVVIINKGQIISEEKISDIRARKLYSVYVYFKERPPENRLKALGLKIVRRINNGYELSVSGNIKNLFFKLQKLDFLDIQIMHSTLEKIFMEYYKES